LLPFISFDIISYMAGSINQQKRRLKLIDHMPNRYYDLNTYFRDQFGERVHKITVDAGMTCPNRDGTVGRGGCIYCNARGSGTGAHGKGLSITQQLEAGRISVGRRFKAKKFMAYFQSFSNTYAPLEQLRAMYEEALAVTDVVGLAIGTRPDCINEPILSLLEGYTRSHLIWIEYGLQSAHEPTLKLINRGHDAACFRQAVEATAGRGIRICAHIILGLPGEDITHMRATARFLAKLPIDGVKMHLLYVVKGTPMETLWTTGQYRCLTQDEYVDRVCDVLEELPDHMVIQRITGDPHAHELAAPLWALEKHETVDRIKARLIERDTWQGKMVPP
jgi:radical SAM protein (TIGR01212 family)